MSTSRYAEAHEPCGQYLFWMLTYSQEQKAEPFTGYSSPDYKGKGQVQSPPKNA